jgi:hypothetical protein
MSACRQLEECKLSHFGLNLEVLIEIELFTKMKKQIRASASGSPLLPTKKMWQILKRLAVMRARTQRT